MLESLPPSVARERRLKLSPSQLKSAMLPIPQCGTTEQRERERERLRKGDKLTSNQRSGSSEAESADPDPSDDAGSQQLGHDFRRAVDLVVTPFRLLFRTNKEMSELCVLAV